MQMTKDDTTDLGALHGSIGISITQSSQSEKIVSTSQSQGGTAKAQSCKHALITELVLNEILM